MNSQCRSAVSIPVLLIAPATSGPGGTPPASIRSRLRASFGRTRGRICHCKPLEQIHPSLPMLSTAKHHKDGVSSWPSYPDESLFHDPSGTAYADLTIEGHRET